MKITIAIIIKVALHPHSELRPKTRRMDEKNSKVLNVNMYDTYQLAID